MAPLFQIGDCLCGAVENQMAVGLQEQRECFCDTAFVDAQSGRIVSELHEADDALRMRHVGQVALEKRHGALGADFFRHKVTTWYTLVRPNQRKPKLMESAVHELATALTGANEALRTLRWESGDSATHAAIQRLVIAGRGVIDTFGKETNGE